MQGNYGYNGAGECGVIIKPTKKSVLDYLSRLYGTTNIVQIESFDSIRTRHICPGMKNILLLDKYVVNVPLYGEIPTMLPVEIFFCNNCRKLYVNKQTLEF